MWAMKNVIIANDKGGGGGGKISGGGQLKEVIHSATPFVCK